MYYKVYICFAYFSEVFIDQLSDQKGEGVNYVV